MNVSLCVHGVAPDILNNRQRLTVKGFLSKEEGAEVIVTYYGREDDPIYAYQMVWDNDRLNALLKAGHQPKDRILLLRVRSKTKTPSDTVVKTLPFPNHAPEKYCFIVYEQLNIDERAVVTKQVSRCLLC